MKQKYITVASKIRKWQGFVVLLVTLFCVSCNEFSKSELAQSVQSYNEKSLPKQMAEGFEWTSISYDKVLDMVVLKYTFDEDIYDVNEILNTYNEERDNMKAQMVPYITGFVNKVDLDGASIKICYGFTRSNKTFELVFSGEEIEQLAN